MVNLLIFMHPRSVCGNKQPKIMCVGGGFVLHVWAQWFVFVRVNTLAVGLRLLVVF